MKGMIEWQVSPTTRFDGEQGENVSRFNAVFFFTDGKKDSSKKISTLVVEVFF
jgi:extradiol dioxygenase family protein